MFGVIHEMCQWILARLRLRMVAAIHPLSLGKHFLPDDLIVNQLIFCVFAYSFFLRIWCSLLGKPVVLADIFHLNVFVYCVNELNLR
jgi:hypothetical protein